jgi:hypothetical protein
MIEKHLLKDICIHYRFYFLYTVKVILIIQRTEFVITVLFSKY